jgi:predicted nucleic acid-binding Zn ribbon protein
MADKRSNNKSSEAQAKRRRRAMQVLFALFSLILILSMVLSAFVTQ